MQRSRPEAADVQQRRQSLYVEAELQAAACRRKSTGAISLALFAGLLLFCVPTSFASNKCKVFVLKGAQGKVNEI